MRCHISPVPLVSQKVHQLHHTGSLLFLLQDVQRHCIQLLGVEYLEELLYYNTGQVLVPALALVPVLAQVLVLALVPVLVQVQVKVHAILPFKN